MSVTSVLDFLEANYGGNSVKDYIQAFCIFIASFLLIWVGKRIFVRYFKTISDRTPVELDDVMIRAIDTVGIPMYLVIAANVVMYRLVHVDDFSKRVVWSLTAIIIAYYIVLALQEFVNFGIKRWMNHKEKVEGNKFDASAIQLIGLCINFSIWLVAILVVLQNFDINVTTLVGTLGIGGIALAFALQSILSEVFASLSIYLDRPFAVGDFIIVGKDMGTVQKIGIKSTRIKTLQGEELVFSNKELTEVRIRNFAQLHRRRVQFEFHIDPATPTAKLRSIPGIVEKIIEGIEICDFGRCHFEKITSYSLQFEIVYFIHSGDYETYMDIQQKINLDMRDHFEKEGIEFAYVDTILSLEEHRVR